MEHLAARKTARRVSSGDGLYTAHKDRDHKVACVEACYDDAIFMGIKSLGMQVGLGKRHRSRSCHEYLYMNIPDALR
jgi:hypothetical protein